MSNRKRTRVTTHNYSNNNSHSTDNVITEFAIARGNISQITNTHPGNLEPAFINQFPEILNTDTPLRPEGGDFSNILDTDTPSKEFGGIPTAIQESMFNREASTAFFLITITQLMVLHTLSLVPFIIMTKVLQICIPTMLTYA